MMSHIPKCVFLVTNAIFALVIIKQVTGKTPGGDTPWASDSYTDCENNSNHQAIKIKILN